MHTPQDSDTRRRRWPCAASAARRLSRQSAPRVPEDGRRSLGLERHVRRTPEVHPAKPLLGKARGALALIYYLPGSLAFALWFVARSSPEPASVLTACWCAASIAITTMYTFTLQFCSGKHDCWNLEVWLRGNLSKFPSKLSPLKKKIDCFMQPFHLHQMGHASAHKCEVHTSCIPSTAREKELNGVHIYDQRLQSSVVTGVAKPDKVLLRLLSNPHMKWD